VVKLPSPLGGAVVALLLTSACSAPSEVVAPVPQPGLHVRGGFIRDEDGRALLLRGLNLAGSHKVTPYFSFQEEPDYVRVRDPWGMNAVRFLVTWAAIEPARGFYDETYLDAVAERMEWAREAGLYVVLDMHQDVYGEGFATGGGDGAPLWTCDESNYWSFKPNTSAWYLNNISTQVTNCWDHFWNSDDLHAHYVEAWRRLAHRLAGYDDVVVGFDPMNEPYWGTYMIVDFEADLLQPFYEQVVAAVRAERPGWLAFTEPSSSRNIGVPTGLTKMSFDDVVYAPHSYDRNAESGAGFDPSNRAEVLTNGAALATEATSLDAALWVGEYGGMHDAPGLTYYMTAEYDAFAAVAAGTTYWSYDEGGSYSVLNADGSERPVLDMIVRPWPERVAGDPVSYAFDVAKSTFALRYKPNRALTAPTVISVPARVYPHGYTVACGGCATKAGAGLLQITSAPPGDVAEVTLTPK
jgi:endoglycosylceramidase